jgi:hypothetical protein
MRAVLHAVSHIVRSSRFETRRESLRDARPDY